MATTPIDPGQHLVWKGPSGHMIYHFPNGVGASVFPQDDGNSFSLAAISLHDPAQGPEGGFHLNYFTPFGPPKEHLSPDDVKTHLTALANYTADDLKREFD